MTISFGETFERVRECFNEQSIVSELVPKLQSVTIIRDVNGIIRLFLDLSEGQKPQEVNTTNLDRLLSEKLGPYYGKDIWLPAGENDAYKSLINTIKTERDFASWDDESDWVHLTFEEDEA